MNKKNHQTMDRAHTTALRASLRGALPHLVVPSFILAGGLALTLANLGTGGWLIGQIILGIAITQWFMVMHEAGHNTLLPSTRANRWVGRFCGLVCLFPFDAWRFIHHRHHVWTGWRDLDPTTENLLPREIKGWEKFIFNNCWKFWIPVFGVAYRAQHFWKPSKIKNHAGDEKGRMIVRGILIQLAFYGALIVLLGVPFLLTTFGLAFLIHLSICDPILLSQHSHIPQEESDGENVSPFPHRDQDVFTRSIEFPKFFSKWVLLHFDLHELHHLFPHIPGYHLDRLPVSEIELENSYHWWSWILEAKRLPAHELIFKNREETGWMF